MRTHLSQHPKHLIATSIALLGAIGALLGTTGVLADATGLPFGATSACGCTVAAAEFSIAATPSPIHGTGQIHFTIKNVSGRESVTIPNLGIKFSFEHKEFIEDTKKVVLCEKKTYKKDEECSFDVEYLGHVNATLGATVEGTNNVTSGLTVSGLTA